MMTEKKTIFERLNGVKVGAPGSLLVFETTGFALYGALAHAGISSMEFEAVGVSQALEFASAVGEVLEQIRTQTKKRLPKKAVLITASAISALLELPVNPEKPRSTPQMSELVRWELESLFGQQSEIWSIGALLMGRGYINAEQRREIQAELAMRNESGTERAKARFGELAQDLGYATREQIDACLALQEKLVLFDDEVVSGWAAQGQLEEEQTEHFPWLAVGIGDATRKQWAKAFRKQGIFLAWIYPHLGAGLGLVAEEREQMLVDIRQEQFAVLRGRPGSLASLRIESCQEGLANPDECAGLCHEQMRPDINRLYLSTQAALFGQISTGLGQRLQREVSALPLPTLLSAVESLIPPQLLTSMAGVAAHSLGQIGRPVLARVEAQPPKPPIWKNQGVWPYAAALVLLMGIIGYDLSLRYQTWQQQETLAALDAEYSERMQIKQQMESAANEVTVLRGQLQLKERELKKKRQELHVFEDVLLKRQESVPGLLRAVADSIGDEVMLDQLEEKEKQAGFFLKGWALSETSAQLFLNRLNKNLERWQYRIVGPQFHRGQGRLKLEGYTLETWLLPITPAEEKKG